MLANGAGGARELAAVVLSKLPDFVWKVLPVRYARAGPAWHPTWHPPTRNTGPSFAQLPALRCFALPPTLLTPQSLKCAFLALLHACSLAVKMKSWATHRVELPELAAPELRQAGSGAHTKV